MNNMPYLLIPYDYEVLPNYTSFINVYPQEYHEKPIYTVFIRLITDTGGGLHRFYKVTYSINSKKKKFELNPEEDLQCLKRII